MEFPVRLVLAASSAAHRINDGFVKKYDNSKKESNSALLYKHFFQGHDLKVEDQDYEMADEIIDEVDVRLRLNRLREADVFRQVELLTEGNSQFL